MTTQPAEISSALQRSGQKIWDDLMSQTQNGQGTLPFVRFNASGEIESAWDVAESCDEIDDLARGVCYAQLLVHRAKTTRCNFDPYQVIEQVLLGIVARGNTGPIERGFLARIAMLALAASLN